MTNITFYQDHLGVIHSLKAEDHAGFAEEGQDIVCAAVSVLITNFVNSLEQLASIKPQVGMQEGEDVEIHVVFPEELTDQGKLLLDSFILGLTYLEHEYQSYVKVIYEEV
ncbi:MAG: ribosomal-processing cysteine protease Prp [Anaerostipes sp.]|nr:ribosomal-processing cysteine protease Prp [Anaerostipes sp.]